MNEVKSCGVLVFRSKPVESFLLMEHRRRLDLPKGHLEPGESEQDCALRELEEETGITADDLELDPDFRFLIQYPVRSKRFADALAQKTVVIFVGRLIRRVKIQVTEHEGYRWVPWDPPHRIQAETIDPLLAALQKYRTAQ